MNAFQLVVKPCPVFLASDNTDKELFSVHYFFVQPQLFYCFFFLIRHNKAGVEHSTRDPEVLPVNNIYIKLIPLFSFDYYQPFSAH